LLLIGVMTSGGDAPGMNAAVRAVVRSALHAGHKVVGIRRGLTGLLAEDMYRMDIGSVADIIYRGGTVLLTGRTDEFKTPEGQRKAVEAIRRNSIDGLVIIGGDGSIIAGQVLKSHGVAVNAIPATIDNDIPCSDVSVGFDTALNTICSAVDKIRDTAEALERTFIVEVMGRKTGFLALASGLAVGATAILVPEYPVDYSYVCSRLKRSISRKKKHSIIILAEGVGSAEFVAGQITSRMGADIRVITLGHVQRGGTPTATDRILASRLGAKATELLLAGQSGKFIGQMKGQITVTDFAEVLSCGKCLDREEYELANVLAI